MSAAGRLRIAAATALVAGVALSARADAPPDQYELFGSAATEIQDHYTGLVWERTPAMQPFTYRDALARCAGLSLGSRPSGWRVPSYKELLTLVDERPRTTYPAGVPVTTAIDFNAFSATIQAPYWTSSIDPNAPGSAFAVDFTDGRGRTEDLTVGLYVRCVHD
ncbi:MAG TPA: DUF1566 domain-containing protein [Polyangiaceae bacterium]|nr:DUF1566 domain-containing protein [Polyangiaceae bacterium]